MLQGRLPVTGYMGQTRLASNSLLESLVWAKRAAMEIAEAYSPVSREWCRTYFIDEMGDAYPDKPYRDCGEDYHNSVRQKIKEERKRREEKRA